MDLAGRFVSTAATVGLVPQLTLYTLVVTALAFVGAAVFFLGAGRRVAPEHRASMGLHAVICLVAGLSYLKIQDDFRGLLQLLADVPPGDRLSLIREGYFAIGQTRYMDWTVTTPLLLLTTVLVLRVRTRHVLGPVLLMLGADVFMVVTGFIGENMLGEGGAVLTGPRLLWGTVSTLGYLVVVGVLFTQFRRHQRAAPAEEARAFQLMALATVTTWGVYPLGYLVPVIWPDADLNLVHIAFSVADLVNKIGVGLIAFWAAATLVEKLHPSQDNPASREDFPGAA